MIRIIVIDASIAVALLIDEPKSRLARAFVRTCGVEGVLMIAPPLFPFEVANALHRRVRDGELTASEATDLFGSLRPFQIRIETADSLHERALTLAAELGQQAAYDAYYLALAEAFDCRFWTADRPFFTTAQRLTDRVRWLGDFDPDADFNPDI